MPLIVGQMLQGNYRIIGLLGQGGMGAVYLAEHKRSDRAASGDQGEHRQSLRRPRQHAMADRHTIPDFMHIDWIKHLC